MVNFRNRFSQETSQNIFGRLLESTQSILPNVFKSPKYNNDAIGSQYLDFLSKQKILQNLNKNDLLLFYRFLNIETYPPNVDLICEGENSQDIYFIYKGEVEILKWDEKKIQKISIGHILQGNPFGEMSFIDGDPRSTTIRTITDTVVLKFNPETFKNKTCRLNEIYDTILYNVTKTSIFRLRSSNRNYVKSLLTQINFGYFFILSLAILGLGNIIFLMTDSFNINPHSIILSWTGLIALLIPNLILLKVFNLPLKDVGVTTYNWKKSSMEGMIIGSGIILVALIAYWIHTLSHPGSKTILEALLQPTVAFTPLDFLYFFHAYIQEFMARGVNQGSLQKFLKDDSGLKTIITTGAMFATLHISRGVEAASAAFMGSIFFGYIYLRHQNLIGVTIVHTVVGVAVINYLTLI